MLDDLVQLWHPGLAGRQVHDVFRRGMAARAPHPVMAARTAIANVGAIASNRFNLCFGIYASDFRSTLASFTSLCVINMAHACPVPASMPRCTLRQMHRLACVIQHRQACPQRLNPSVQRAEVGHKQGRQRSTRDSVIKKFTQQRRANAQRYGKYKNCSLYRACSTTTSKSEPGEK